VKYIMLKRLSITNTTCTNYATRERNREQLYIIMENPVIDLRSLTGFLCIANWAKFYALI
jgi:hypothetical protein